MALTDGYDMPATKLTLPLVTGSGIGRRAGAERAPTRTCHLVHQAIEASARQIFLPMERYVLGAMIGQSLDSLFVHTQASNMSSSSTMPELPRTNEGMRLCQIIKVRPERLEEYNRVCHFFVHPPPSLSKSSLSTIGGQIYD